MKRNLLKRMVLAALVAGSLAVWQPLSEAAVQVNPIPGLPADFIKGADVSMLPQMEEDGAKYYDEDGTQLDEMQIMKNHGVNWVRFRIFNHPTLGGGFVDAKRALALTQRAHALGLKVLIDFHYSDWWADPGHQVTPAAWAGHNAARLEKDVYDYTKKVLTDFQKAGQQPEMVQIGNELKSGMLWPVGKLPAKDGGKTFSRLMAAGLKAAHDCDPGHKTRLMVHLPDGGDNAVYRTFFDMLIKDNGVDDFDIIGLSYYPFWHGTPAALQANMNDISQRYNKDVVVVETAFGYTNENHDRCPNLYGAKEERAGGFKSSVQGQATGLRTVMDKVAQVPNHRGLGIFYWEPDWYSIPGVGGGVGDDNGWESLAMFDGKGKALESWNTFADVSNQSLPTVPVTIDYVETQAAEGGPGSTIALPKEARVAFSDEHTEMLPVTWETPAPVYQKQGRYNVDGTVTYNGEKHDVLCVVDVSDKVNCAQNGDFESGSLKGWTITGDPCVDLVQKTGDALGTSAMHYWSDKAFAFTASQTLTNLPDGKYTLKVSTQGGGGQSKYELFCEVNGKRETAPITDTKWNEWHTFTIKDIEVKGGKATIGVTMQAKPGTWGSIDNFEFVRQ
ncbi:MAG: glycosyl hydrolase 53 family protein [Selenomonadaceae bacterium]|nr:glycosyl hydrolase 53 family protein [Selenomonadaceae bacterium]